MLSTEDHPGIVTFLIGMIVLVMVAVGLSIIVDKRLRFSSGSKLMQEEIAAVAAEISDLQIRKDSVAREFADASTSRQMTSKERLELSALMGRSKDRLAALAQNRDQLRVAIAGIESDFARYRADYRRRTWAAALGEKLGDLTVRGGRIYRGATVTRVTDVGLEVRHEHGIARIQAPDLEQKLQDRFQWNDEERRNRLKQELADAEAAASFSEHAAAPAGRKEGRRPPKISSLSGGLAPTEASPDAEKIRGSRQQVVAWRTKVDSLASEQVAASSQARYGKQASVPGSLETWAARADRLGRDLARARVSLSLAKLNLASVSPADPLLESPESE